MHITRFEREATTVDDDQRGKPLLVDRRKAAWLMGVSPGTIDNLRLRGDLPSVKVASRRLYDVGDLMRYIDARKAVNA